MRPFEDFQKHAMREAMDKVYSWKQEHPDEYSRFSVRMMKMERNDFGCLERIFKMAVSFVPTHVLIECRKLLAPDSEEILSADERVAAASRVVDELMGLKGYLRFGVYTETVGDKDAPDQTEQFLIREFSLSDKDMSEEDDEHIYVPYVTAQEFWESLPSFIQMAIFTFGKGHSADELATLSKRIMLSAIQALPEIFVKLRDQIHDGSNSLLMCTLYYICFDHGLPRSAMALSKVSLGAKQVSYIRESVKAIVEKLVETSVDNALDKKAEWTTQAKDIEDVELKQAIKTTLASTKGKHGRRTILQEEMSLDEILISDDKQALKETIRTALNEMEHEYETAYIKAALIRSHHLAPHASFSVFLRAISDFTGREYKYDPAQRVDSFIYHNEKEFQTSKSSKWQRGRRIVSYLTDIFDTIQ
ncbi:MAG: hypothetical protein SPI30_04540 [Prevotella sp.]|nr:hypothetical protein [Prevotella sp.]